MSQKTKYQRKALRERKPVSMTEFLKSVQSIVWAKKPRCYCCVEVQIGQHQGVLKGMVEIDHKYKCYFNGGTFYDGKTPEEAIAKMKEAISKEEYKTSAPSDAIV